MTSLDQMRLELREKYERLCKVELCKDERKRDERIIAENIAKRLEEGNVKFYEVGLFGSRAKSTARIGSDWDFYVVVPEDFIEGMNRIERLVREGAIAHNAGLRKGMKGFMDDGCITEPRTADLSKCIDVLFVPKGMKPDEAIPIISRGSYRSTSRSEESTKTVIEKMVEDEGLEIRVIDRTPNFIEYNIYNQKRYAINRIAAKLKRRGCSIYRWGDPYSIRVRCPR